MGITAKEKARVKLLEYLGNPEHDFPSRAFMSNEILGYQHPNQVNILFTALELQEIEYEALEIRKKNSAKIIGKAYKALEKQFDKSVPAIIEYLNRMEGKVSDRVKLDADVNAKISPLTDDELDAEIDRLLNEKDK